MKKENDLKSVKLLLYQLGEGVLDDDVKLSFDELLDKKLKNQQQLISEALVGLNVAPVKLVLKV